MKILKFTGENVKRLKFVEIEPDPDSLAVILRGKNEQGKSSVLDAIWYALGGKASVQGVPIREGEVSAYSEVDLGEFTVKRTWTEKNSYLTITDSRGAKLSNPQTILDKLMGKLSDPHALARMDKKQQREIFINLLGIGDQLEDLDNEIQKVVVMRQELNRDMKRIKGNYESFPDVEGDLPEEPLSVAELMEDLRKAEEQQKVIDDAERTIRHQADYNRAREEEIEELKAKLRDLETELGDLETDLAGGRERYNRLSREFSYLRDPDIDPIRQQIASADTINEQIRKREAKRDAKRDLEVTQERYENLGQEKAELEKKKLSILSDADMPIDGLGIDADGITLNGLPIENASDAQRTLIFAAIAMAMNPEIKILKISDGSLLDDEHMDKLIKMAEEKGFQLWIESVGVDGAGVIIEDGAVKETV
jgi:DNA repair exonuclease SbcCD ATPase subunit